MKITGLNYIGDLRAGIGLSEYGRRLVTAIEAAGLALHYVEVPYRAAHPTGSPALTSATQTRFPISLIDVNAPQFYEAAQVTADLLRDTYRIALWAWELDRFPARWRRNFALLDEVWVASQYAQATVAQAAPVPVVRMPCPVEVTTSPGARRADFNLPENRFIVLHIFSPSSSSARKNPFGVIEAFRQVFGDDSDKALLVIKTHDLNTPETATLATTLREAVQSVGGVLIEDYLSRQQMNDLIGLCDVLVSLHRAEGFGLTLAEAMALGKPVVATAYSGNLDFMTPGNSYGVPYTLRAITEDDHRYQPHQVTLYEPGYRWAEPDIEQAAAWLSHIFHHPDEARTIGARAARNMNTLFDRAVIAQRIRERLQIISSRR